MTILDAAAKILKDTGRPLHVKEITRRMIETALWVSKGKTPARTVGAILYMEIKKHGDQSTFVKTAPKTFALRNIQDVKKSESSNVSDSTNPKETYSFLDAAEKVLIQFGNRKPMHYREITNKAINQGWLITEGKTPDATMIAQLVREIKRAKASDSPGRFVCTSRGYYSLVKWTGTGLPNQISKHNQDVRKKLRSKLMNLNPFQFEELIGLLLAEMGFESIEVTQRGKDGGIDVRGTLLISDAIRIKMAVQAKRWRKNVQSPTVTTVRGSLGAHEQGLIITTSDFSAGARKEANEPAKTPIGLMNGKQLVGLLMEYEIGVRRIPHNLFELEELPIAEN